MGANTKYTRKFGQGLISNTSIAIVCACSQTDIRTHAHTQLYIEQVGYFYIIAT